MPDFGGGGGGGGGATQSTVTNTNIPEYARPYVETMLGATQQQLFNTTQGPDGTTQITGVKGYTPFGAGGGQAPGQYNPTTGQYDFSQGIGSWKKPILPPGVDPRAGAANPQGYQQWMQGAQQQEARQPGSTMLGQTYGAGMGPQEMKAAQAAVAGFTPLQQQAQAGIAGLQLPGTFGQAAQAAGDITQQAMGYGAGYRPADINILQAQAPQLQAYQMGPAREVSAQQVGTPLMDAAQTGYAPQLSTYQMGPAQQVRTQSFLRPGTSQAYMSPYMQDVVNVQQQEAKRLSDIAGTQLAGQATQAGAFGGSRYGLMEAERQRNLATQLGQIQATGSQAAFQNAQQQFNQEQQARLAAQQANQQAGLQVGGQNLAAALGVQQLGTQTGLQTALANLSSAQQANVQNQAAQLQTQGMNAQQALQAALANQQAGLTVGQQNLAAQLGVQQLGAVQDLQAQLANQQALQSAQQLQAQQQQFGANLGLQGLQTGLQGANALASIGGQQLGAQQGILGLQAQTGAAQQHQQQNLINQMIQNYATAQQYPQQQLAFMNAMIRGLPLQTTTTQGYQAAPSMMSQLTGLGLAGAGAYGMATGRKKGGKITQKAGMGIDDLAMRQALEGA